jgi:hypothetical protein
MYVGPLNRPIIIVVAIFAIPLAVREFNDYLHICALVGVDFNAAENHVN